MKSIIELAREAGMTITNSFADEMFIAVLTRFASLVRAAALEEAAQVCEELDEEVCWKEGRLASGYGCAAAIREMKESRND